MQTFGDLANFNPHLHWLAADGVSGADGTFIALPPVPEALLAEGFRCAVLEFLVKERAITDELRTKMLCWRYCGGFSAHKQVRVAAADREGRIKLAGTMIRAQMSLEKMSYDAGAAHPRSPGALGARALRAGRADNVYGDRNLFCSCVPIEAYQ